MPLSTGWASAFSFEGRRQAAVHPIPLRLHHEWLRLPSRRIGRGRPIESHQGHDELQQSSVSGKSKSNDQLFSNQGPASCSKTLYCLFWTLLFIFIVHYYCSLLFIQFLMNLRIFIKFFIFEPVWTNPAIIALFFFYYLFFLFFLFLTFLLCFWFFVFFGSLECLFNSEFLFEIIRQVISAEIGIFQMLARLPQSLQNMRMTITAEYKDKFIRANETFLHQIVLDPLQRRLLPLTPLPAGMDGASLTHAGQ